MNELLQLKFDDILYDMSQEAPTGVTADRLQRALAEAGAPQALIAAAAKFAKTTEAARQQSDALRDAVDRWLASQ
jgi:hypothetical protein